jgi:hypothetical protein
VTFGLGSRCSIQLSYEGVGTAPLSWPGPGDNGLSLSRGARPGNRAGGAHWENGCGTSGDNLDAARPYQANDMSESELPR